MSNPIEYVKAHPVQVGVIVVVGGIIFLALSGILGGGGSGSSAPVAAGPTDAQLAAQTQMGLANIALQGQQLQANSDLQVAKLGADVQVALANLQTNLGLQQLSVGREVAIAQMANDNNIAGLQAELQKYSIGANVDLQKYSIGSNAGIQMALIDALKPPPPAPALPAPVDNSYRANGPVGSDAFWDSYGQHYSDIYAHWVGNVDNVQQSFATDDDYYQYHFEHNGVYEGRVLPTA